LRNLIQAAIGTSTQHQANTELITVKMIQNGILVSGKGFSDKQMIQIGQKARLLAQRERK